MRTYKKVITTSSEDAIVAHAHKLCKDLPICCYYRELKQDNKEYNKLYRKTNVNKSNLSMCL